MKKIISTIIVIVMLLMVSGNLGVFAVDDVMMSAYLDVLNSHSENGMTPRYLIYDIDGNGASELLIMNGTCEGDKQLYIYAYLDKNVCCLGEIGAWHAWYQKVPNKNGLVLFWGRAMEGTLISIVSNKLYTEEGYQYTEDMIDIGFTDKSDISGFGNFNYIPVNNVSIASFNAGIGRGIEYYNEGLYYQAINEIQCFCDANWYSMTAEQQQKALYYLNNAKSKLADYSFTTGKNYYNKGLYYEAQKEFINALNMYTKNTSQWQSANDYLYNTNEKIKSLENWIWVKDYYFNFIGKTRTQIDNSLGHITNIVWNNVPYYRHKNDRNALFCYNKYAGADYMAASYSICIGVETTVGGLVGISNSYNNIEDGLRKVFSYDTYFIDECTNEWCWVYKHNGYVIMIDGPNISLNSRAYIYKDK